MAGLSNIDQAKRSIMHVLSYMRENWEVGYQLGVGTQSFALLTECYTNITGEELEEFRQRMAPRPPGKDERPAIEILHAVMNAFHDYKIALERREHGGVASGRLIEKIEEILTPKT